MENCYDTWDCHGVMGVSINKVLEIVDLIIYLNLYIHYTLLTCLDEENFISALTAHWMRSASLIGL